MALLPQLELSAPSRSNFDLSYINRFTCAPGILYPIMVQRCLPGDSYEISLKHLVKTMALKAPLMGRMVMQFDFFFCPDRLYVKQYRLDKMSLSSYDGDSNGDVSYPFFQLSSNLPVANASVVGPGLSSSSLLNFLGFPSGYRSMYTGSSFPSGSPKFQAFPLLSYYDIFRNYYRNPQESVFYMYTGIEVPDTNTYGVDTYIDSVSCEELDRLFDAVSNGNLFVNDYAVPTKALGMYARSATFGGLCLRCYKPDYFSNFINSAAYNAVTSNGGKVAIQSSMFSINQFRLANKLQKMSERSIVAGNRYGEFIRAMFGVRTDDKLDVPEYMGSFSSRMDFQDIVSQTGGADAYNPATGSYPLGSSAGRGISADGSKKFYFDISEFGTLMCMFSIVPYPDYFEGVKKDLTKIYLSDEFNPQLDRLGWQTLTRSEYYALPSALRNIAAEGETPDYKADAWGQTPTGTNPDPFTQSVAYQVAWLELMTRTNELHGEFSSTLNYWTLGRTFNRDGSDIANSNNITPSAYIFPTDYNVPFVDNSITAQNFMVQVAFDIFAKRPISKKMMPNLG